MAADVVECEGRLTCGGFPDLSVWDEACFDEGLEAIADPENESIAVVDEVHDRVCNLWVTENGGDELT